MKMKLWTINDTTNLLEKVKSRKKVRSLFRGECVFARREHNKCGGTGNLMPEEEYFIPLPVKCIGDYFDRTDELDDEGRRLLTGIQEYYFSRHPGKPYQEYWEGLTINDRHQKMQSAVYKGYYQIIEEQTECDKQNILIGYSLGGMVAKFLAFLDKYVFKKNLIAGVIIVNAPVTGSPLANPENGEMIVDGAIELFFSFISFYTMYEKKGKSYAGFDDFIGYMTDKIDYHHLISMLKMIGKDARELGEVDSQFETLNHGVQTFEFWLSGLNNDCNSAFFDLNIKRSFDPYSVISLINDEAYPLDGIYQGVVAGTENDVRSFFRTFLAESWGSKVQFLYPFIEAVLKVQRMFGLTIYDNMKKATRIFRSTIMVEKETPPAGSLMEKKVRQYHEGIKELGIKRRSHDFIIPTVYQIIDIEPDEWFLGNHINPHASHNSGCLIHLKGGQVNMKYIIKFLTEMRKRGVGSS